MNLEDIPVPKYDYSLNRLNIEKYISAVSTSSEETVALQRFFQRVSLHIF